MEKTINRGAKKYNWRYRLLHFCWRIINFFSFGYKAKAKYKIKKGETVLVLSNHQTDLDAFFINLSFNRPLFAVTTDTLFSGHFKNWLFSKHLGLIPKRKGQADIKTTIAMSKTIEQGGSVLLFPEGNRTYAEFQYYIDENLPKFIKNLKTTLILFNIHGGMGVYPRWHNKRRKGEFYGDIKQVLTYEEYKDIPDDELYKIIKDGIRVFDYESHKLYKSNRRAEYMERMVFVCPKCEQMNTMFSKRNVLACNNCGLMVTYNEDLTLGSTDKDFHFTILNDWYQYQKKFVLNYEVKENEVIFMDKNIRIMNSAPDKRQYILGQGKMMLTDKMLSIRNVRFQVSEIEGASPISGTRLQIVYNGKNYIIKGKDRFNPLKYMLMLNKLNTKMKLEKSDHYYRLED